MSGHSKWHNIQNTKGKADAKRSKTFTKISREIAVAVKLGGANIETNSKLASLIIKAKQNNIPNDNIDRTIKKASGESGGINYENCTYEGYGIGGSAVIVECLTDNKNRTAGDVRHAFDKFGGSLGSTGCVSYLFQRKGVIVVEKKGIEVDELMMESLDLGAVDLQEYDEEIEVLTEPNDVQNIADELAKKSFIILSSEASLVPDNNVTLDEKQFATFQKMVDMLEDFDDVQEVFHNVNLPE